MPHGTEKANEFKRYRQILAALYVAIIALGFLLLAASVVRQLFFRPVVQLEGPVLSAENPSPEDLLRCHADVAELYQELDRVATFLISSPLPDSRRVEESPTPDRPGPEERPDERSDDAKDITGEWERFSRTWLAQWERVNAFCRFSELEDTNMGDAYDRMARVHEALPTMRLKYQSLLVRFDDEQADELARMRRDLSSSEKLLLRERQGSSEEQAP